MTELTEIKCNVADCKAHHKEEFFNQGHPGWGHVAGIIDTETGEDKAHACPRHMKIFKAIFNGDFGIEEMNQL